MMPVVTLMVNSVCVFSWSKFFMSLQDLFFCECTKGMLTILNNCSANCIRLCRVKIWPTQKTWLQHLYPQTNGCRHSKSSAYTQILAWTRLNQRARRCPLLLPLISNSPVQTQEYYEAQIWHQEAASRKAAALGHPIPKDNALHGEVKKKWNQNKSLGFRICPSCQLGLIKIRVIRIFLVVWKKLKA